MDVSERCTHVSVGGACVCVAGGAFNPVTDSLHTPSCGMAAWTQVLAWVPLVLTLEERRGAGVRLCA